MGYDLARLRQISDQVAVVGVGDTDYAKDYEAARQARQAGQDEAGALDSYGLGALAFRRALEETGLKKEDIDGIAVGGPIVHQRMCEILGINPVTGADVLRVLGFKARVEENGLVFRVKRRRPPGAQPLHKGKAPAAPVKRSRKKASEEVSS